MVKYPIAKLLLQYIIKKAKYAFQASFASRILLHQIMRPKSK